MKFYVIYKDNQFFKVGEIINYKKRKDEYVLYEYDIKIIEYHLIITVLRKERQNNCRKINKVGDKEMNLVHTDVLLQPEKAILFYPLMSKRLTCRYLCC